MAAIDQSYMSSFSQDAGAYKAWHLGTAAGTTQIANQPAFFSHIQINQRAASGTIAMYDAGTAALTGTGLSGTAGSLIAYIIFGTQTNSDNPPPYTYKIATRTGLSICNSANIDFTVAALP